MNLIELQRALRQPRFGGIAEVLETRLRQAQTESMAPINLVSYLVSEELERHGTRLLERLRKQAPIRVPQKTLDAFDFIFNPKMNRSLIFDLATAGFISRHKDALFLGPPGTGKSRLAQAIGLAAIAQGYRVVYRGTHALLDDIAEATIDGARKPVMKNLATLRCASCRHRDARPIAPSWSHPQMRTTELAGQNGLAQPPLEGVKLQPFRVIPLAGFAVTIVGRFK